MRPIWPLTLTGCGRGKGVCDHGFGKKIVRPERLFTETLCGTMATLEAYPWINYGGM